MRPSLLLPVSPCALCPACGWRRLGRRVGWSQRFSLRPPLYLALSGAGVRLCVCKWCVCLPHALRQSRSPSTFIIARRRFRVADTAPAPSISKACPAPFSHHMPVIVSICLCDLHSIHTHPSLLASLLPIDCSNQRQSGQTTDRAQPQALPQACPPVDSHPIESLSSLYIHQARRSSTRHCSYHCPTERASASS